MWRRRGHGRRQVQVAEGTGRRLRTGGAAELRLGTGSASSGAGSEAGDLEPTRPERVARRGDPLAASARGTGRLGRVLGGRAGRVTGRVWCFGLGIGGLLIAIAVAVAGAVGLG